MRGFGRLFRRVRQPALGVASDLVVRHGGTAILAETTDTYGAEHLFTRRTVSREVGEKLVELMYWWEDIRTSTEPRSTPTRLPATRPAGSRPSSRSRSARW